MTKALTKPQRQRLSQDLVLAAEGRLKWLHTMCQESGFRVGGRSSEDRPGPDWWSKSELAALFGVSEAHFDRHFRRMIPDSKIKKGAKRVWFSGRAAIDGYIRFTLDKQMPVKDAESDPLMAGDAGGPALERYRTAKANLVEMDVEERRGTMVPKQEMHEVMVRCATIIRETGARLGREFGRDAQEMLDEALDDFQEEIDSALAAGKEKE